MNDTKHTPGPWESAIWVHSGRPDTVCVKDALGREIIAWSGFDGVPCTKEQIKANARLIAAAPELLEALQAVFADHDSVNRLSWTDQAATAIAKATGAA